MIAALLGMVLATPAAASCTAAHPRGCNETNRLVWAKDFRPALARFLGRSAAMRVDYLYRGTLIRQLEDALGGPPDDPRPLADGGLLFTACRAHSCTEKGAIAFDSAGRMIAAAVVDFRCGGRSGDCADAPVLDIYVRDAAASAVARRAMVDWAKAATAEDARVLHNGPLGEPVLYVIR